MKIIVTGATGFIGTALCEELLRHGHEVIAVIRPESKKRQKLCYSQMLDERLQIIEMALDDLESLYPRIRHADLFYHLAWNGSAGNAREDFDIQYSNIKYTADAVRTAVKCGCRKFIGAGSQAEYGVVCGIAKEEETIPHPFMMYGAAKLAAYQMANVLASQSDILFVWPRIYSVYGVGENAGTLVSYVIDALLSEEVPQLSSCENLWNFMYITDCVKALRMLGECQSAEGIYHVASEDTRVLRSFVEEIRDIVLPDSKLEFGVRISNPQKTFILNPDISKLKNLGFNNSIMWRDGIRRCKEYAELHKVHL